MTTDNLKFVFRFPFEDKEWLPKLGLFLLFTLGGVLVIPAFFIAGYIYEMRRRIIVDKAPPSLPDWENWDTLFVNGLKLAAVSTVYNLPAIVLWFGGYAAAMIFPLFTALGEGGVWLSLFSMPLMWLGMGLGMLFFFLGMTLSIVGTDHMIARDEFAAAFHFKELWCVFSKNFMGYLITFVIIMGLWMVAMYGSQILIMTIVFCCIGYPAMYVLMTYVSLISSVLFAQAYVDGAAACEQPGTEIVVQEVVEGEIL